MSLLALVATFYQLYLQRVHNEKSLTPLVQINLTDNAGLINVHVQNNGVGPFIVEKLTFVKDGKTYDNIQQCLSLSPRAYQHISVNESVKKVLLPGAFLEVFSKQFDLNATKDEIEDVRKELAALTLKVEGRDIYKNGSTTERKLTWFVRHSEPVSMPV